MKHIYTLLKTKYILVALMNTIFLYQILGKNVIM